jgi:hypothetical protein
MMGFLRKVLVLLVARELQAHVSTTVTMRMIWNETMTKKSLMIVMSSNATLMMMMVVRRGTMMT